MIAGRKFLLRQFQGPADDFRLWGSLHPLEVGCGERLGVAIRARGPPNGLGGHRPGRIRCFAGSSRLAHVAPCLPAVASSLWCKQLILATTSGMFGFVVPLRISRGR